MMITYKKLWQTRQNLRYTIAATVNQTIVLGVDNDCDVVYENLVLEPHPFLGLAPLGPTDLGVRLEMNSLSLLAEFIKFNISLRFDLFRSYSEASVCSDLSVNNAYMQCLLGLVDSSQIR